MSYDGRFRFQSIEPRRFYDAPSLAYIAIVVLVVGVQALLFISGKPGLRAVLGL